VDLEQLTINLNFHLEFNQVAKARKDRKEHKERKERKERKELLLASLIFGCLPALE
jgi:hypothetical protein